MNNANTPAMPSMLKAGDMAQSEGGFTKREELAARNMAAILSANPPHDVEHEHMFEYMTMAAGYAVMSADALLSALGKEVS